MPWDKKIKSWVVVMLTIMGTPIFWLVYGIVWTITTVERGLRKGVSSCWWQVRVIKTAWWRIQAKPRKRREGFSRRVVVGIIVIVVAGGGSLWWWVLRDLPKPSELLTRKQSLTTRIYDRHGILLYKLYKNQNRTIVPLDSLPPYVIQATLAIEDAEFYQHPGFSIKGISRALRANLKSDSLQGGSTITQQLVKNALLSSERTIIRKVKEFVLAMEVEYFFTKEEILAMYLNEVGYGGTAYGIEEAAYYYFGKPARELTLAEAALLAGLPASPTTYSPFGNRPDLAIERQRKVLARMRQEKMITAEEEAAAVAEPLQFALPKNDILAPHFVMYVKDWLVEHFGEEMVHNGGLEVVTTLDYPIQQQAEEAINQELERLKGMRVGNGAAMVTQPMTGEILAMVGSKDYFDTSIDGQVNVTLRPRQPGSAIKPLTYALAIESGVMTAATIIDDAPITYQSPGSKPYSPQNYDGKFHGKVSVRQALANSYNVPAVKTLALVGIPQLVGLAQKMGITTWNDSSRYGLALTLGGGEVLMRDMMEAYGVLANGGYRVPLVPVLRVSDYKGKTLFTYDGGGRTSQQIISSETAFIISDILADNAARTPAFGSRSVLVIEGKRVAVKTGTTNDLRDNWTFGYTPDYLVGTWVGNNDNTPMSRVASGITGASPIWQTIMKMLLTNRENRWYEQPTGVVKKTICLPSQTLACAGCPVLVEEYFKMGSEPKVTCSGAAFIPSPTPTGMQDKTLKRDRLLNGIRDQRKRQN